MLSATNVLNESMCAFMLIEMYAAAFSALRVTHDGAGIIEKCPF